jgi:hypothetical protein
LHGWLDSASSFNALAPLVLEQDCNLIIYAPEFLVCNLCVCCEIFLNLCVGTRTVESFGAEEWTGVWISGLYFCDSWVS